MGERVVVNTKLTYPKIVAKLSALGQEELISLLDSPSMKIGDAAVDLLSRRRVLDAVYDAVCAGGLKKALGKKRALYLLVHAGPRYRKGLDACVRLLRDRSKLVVSEALFGLCHWNDQSTLTALDTVTCRAVAGDVRLARRANKARDISIFSQHYFIHEKWSEYQSFAG